MKLEIETVNNTALCCVGNESRMFLCASEEDCKREVESWVSLRLHETQEPDYFDALLAYEDYTVALLNDLIFTERREGCQYLARIVPSKVKVAQYFKEYGYTVEQTSMMVFATKRRESLVFRGLAEYADNIIRCQLLVCIKDRFYTLLDISYIGEVHRAQEELDKFNTLSN